MSVIVTTPEELQALISAAIDERLKPLLKLLKEDSQPIYQSKKVGIESACEIIGRSKATIYRLTSNNEMPYEKHGMRLVFDVERLKIWLQETARK